VREKSKPWRALSLFIVICILTDLMLSVTVEYCQVQRWFCTREVVEDSQIAYQSLLPTRNHANTNTKHRQGCWSWHKQAWSLTLHVVVTAAVLAAESWRPRRPESETVCSLPLPNSPGEHNLAPARSNWAALEEWSSP
jgi:hypothetical protein